MDQSLLRSSIKVLHLSGNSFTGVCVSKYTIQTRDRRRGDVSVAELLVNRSAELDKAYLEHGSGPQNILAEVPSQSQMKPHIRDNSDNA